MSAIMHEDFTNDRIIRGMKGLPDGSGARFPIRDENMSVIGYLRGFDRFLLRDENLIEIMARCHTLYKDNFLTQFDVSPENKRRWLEESVLGNDRKMLFLVETPDGRVIGQDGFTLLGGGVFEHDGTMRFSRGGHPDIFVRDSFERAAICFFLLGCEKFKVEIFKKNVIAIDNALALGLSIKAEHALTRSEGEGVVSYRIASDPAAINTDEILVEFSMEKEAFAKSHGALIENPCWEGFLRGG